MAAAPENSLRRDIMWCFTFSIRQALHIALSPSAASPWNRLWGEPVKRRQKGDGSARRGLQDKRACDPLPP
ncbi:hypothetical protein GCM10017322_27600 [Paracoccus aerius]|nr:hypothetical protein GCM10017322_27600 [Paracoccus aerius]